ncbi:MAG TPA: high-potential iron-sulfur protein [Myxococcota bacterium]|nr:high-potential iron-sulfur protein [Myxococcota bacterium]
MTGSNDVSDTDRRQFLKLAATSLAALSLSSSLLPGRAAAEAQEVDPKDPMAVSLGYQCEGAKAPGYVAGQTCKNCQLYSGAADAKSGPCTLFPGKLVCSGGWCKAWVKQAA